MSVAFLQSSQLPVRLCRPLCAYLVPLRPERPFRSRSLTSTFNAQPRKPSLNTRSRSLHSAQASGGISMTDRYGRELQAACDAVRLAARLCTVRRCSLQRRMLAIDGIIHLVHAPWCRKCSCSSKQGRSRTRAMTHLSPLLTTVRGVL